MRVSAVVPQLRTTDLRASIAFYVERLGFELAFEHSDFYAGISAGGQQFHLKLVDNPDPSIEFVRAGGHIHLFFPTDDVDRVAAAVQAAGVTVVKPLAMTDRGSRELYVADDQGHVLCFAQTEPG